MSVPAAPPRRPRGWRFRAGLRVHLAAFALAVLLPAAAFGALAVREALDGQQGRLRMQLASTARALALAVDAELMARRATLQALAISPLVEEIGQGCRFHDWARRIGEAHGSWLVLSGPRGEGGYPQLVNTLLPCGAPGPVGGPDAALEQVFRTGLPTVANLFRGHASGRGISAVLVPVRRGEGVVAVLGIPFDPSQLSAVLARFAAGNDLTLSLIDAAHVVVARSHEVEATVGQPAPAETVTAISGQRSGFLLGRTASGEELAMGFERLSAAPGWTVVAGLPAGQYARSWTAPFDRLLAGGLVALGAALFIGAFGTRRLLRPMGELSAAADAVSAGETERWASPPVSGVAEFDRLAASLARAHATLGRRAAALRAAVEGLARESRRYRALAEAGTLTAWRADPSGAITEGQGWSELTGQPDDALRGEGWLDMVHPEDRGAAIAAWEAARRRGQPLDVEYRVRRRREGGEWRWVRARGVPVRAVPGGPIEEWVGVIEDAHGRRSHEERQALLSRELDHRAKNALAVVQAALRLTRAPDVPSYIRAVEGRVAALARAHTLLAEDRWTGADLHALLEGELAPFLSPGEGGPRATLEGPRVALPAAVAQPLGMAVHELATNAVKHGALSTPGGRVSVGWALEGGGVLRLRWSEAGGPPVPGPPARGGVGTRVLDGTVRRQLGGGVEMRWEAEGLRCELTVPLRDGRDEAG